MSFNGHRISVCSICAQPYNPDKPHICGYTLGGRRRPRAQEAKLPIGSHTVYGCSFCGAQLNAEGKCDSLGCSIGREKREQEQRIVLSEAFTRIRSNVEPEAPEAPAPVELRAVANEPDAEVVKQIESLLARAKSGEVRAVALASVNADGSCGTAWAGDRWAGDRWAALLGISFELLCRLREEGTPAETPSR